MSFKNSEMIDWINKNIEQKNQGRFSKCLDIFLNRFSPYVLDDPFEGGVSFLRIYRTASILLSNGQIKSTENFFIKDAELFQTSETYRKNVITSASWDNKATFLSPIQPLETMNNEKSLLNWNGDGFLTKKIIDEQIKQLEYLLNTEFRKEDVNFLEKKKNSHRFIEFDLKIEFEDIYKNFIAKRIPECLNYFRCQLSEDIMNIIEPTNENNLSSYNWLAGKKSAFQNNINPEMDISKMRIQAVKSFPFLYKILTSPQYDFREIIDTAQKLNEPLAKELDVPVKVIKNSNGLTFNAANLNSNLKIEHIKMIMKQIQFMPDGKRPQNETEWQNYFLFLNFISKMGYDIPGINSYNDDVFKIVLSEEETIDNVKKILAPFSGKWSSLNQNSLRYAINGIQDCLLDFHNNIMYPAKILFNIDNWTFKDTVNFILRGKTIEDIVKYTTWWHDKREEVRNFLAINFPLPDGLSSIDTWEPLHENKILKLENLYAVPLISKNDLNDEHNRMSHCVDTYADRCMFNGCHIISFRDINGNSIATAELNWYELKNKIFNKNIDISNQVINSLPEAVVQYRGKNNDVPDRESYRALWLYISGLSNGNIKVDIEKIEERYGMLKMQSGKFFKNKKVDFFYNFKMENALKEAWKLYSPMMSKSVAKKGPITMKEFLEQQNTEQKKKKENNININNSF